MVRILDSSLKVQRSVGMVLLLGTLWVSRSETPAYGALANRRPIESVGTTNKKDLVHLTGLRVVGFAQCRKNWVNSSSLPGLPQAETLLTRWCWVNVVTSTREVYPILKKDFSTTVTTHTHAWLRHCTLQHRLVLLPQTTQQALCGWDSEDSFSVAQEFYLPPAQTKYCLLWSWKLSYDS